MRKTSQSSHSPINNNSASSRSPYQHPSPTSHHMSNSLGSLPSWFPQSHLHSSSRDANPAQTFPFADSRVQMRPELYPLMNSSAYSRLPNYDSASQAATTSKNGTNGKGAVKKSQSVVRVENNGNRADKKNNATFPLSEKEEDSDDKKGSKKKTKKRRRVVVACDVCRRKKVKCEGLPNPSNTCENCQNFGYTCAFTVEADRSRGRYDILEQQKDAVLAALRHVAPSLAEQFDRGELSASSLNGLPQFVALDDVGSGQRERAAEGATSGKTVDSNKGAAPSSEHDSSTLSRDLGPMIPDLEDGRPRYFGGSSNLTNFHHLDSRPPSPGMSTRQKLPDSPTKAAEAGKSRQSIDVPTQNAIRPSTGEGSVSRLAVLPRPRPIYPSNSIGWVRNVRKKTLVAIGRDEIYGAEGWFQRFPFPETGLLNELLDLFFQQLNPLLPIIHEQSLRKDLALGRAEKDSAFRGLVFTMIAIASRFMNNDPRVLAEEDQPDSAGDHWAAASRFHHQVYAASLINVQVLLLTSTFMPSTLGVGTSWTVLGVAIRALQDIGLHTEKAYSEYSPFEQEMRRRAFWAAVILDGILSINMGRPSALRLSDTSVKLPLLATEEALMRAESGGPIEEQSSFDLSPCPAAGFIHLIKLNIIVQDVVQTLYSPRWKQEFGQQYLITAGHTATQQQTPATYKDMTILSKRLDEWVAAMPSHLQSVQASPYKLQAGLLQCGRHDIRLYILKPFVQDVKPSFPQPNGRGAGGKGSVQEESILKKMLLPQCASHARDCLRLLAILEEEGQLSHMVFVMQQAFLSAATFMLTVWHEARDVEVLSQDKDLIEATLRMLRPEENRYCSALLRRAQRVLCNIARRVLRAIPEEEQRNRIQNLIDLQGSDPMGGGPKLFYGGASHKEHRQSIKEDVDKNNLPKEILNGTGYGGEPLWLRGSDSRATGASSHHTPSSGLPEALAFADSKSDSFKRDMDTGDVHGPGDWPLFSGDEFVSALRDDFGVFSHFSELNWTDYFSKFLGGLPNPDGSPLASGGFAISPHVHQTP